MEEQLRLFASAMAPELTAWRRYLHAHPELSFQEHETTTWIAKKLEHWSIPFTRPAPTGLVGSIVGARPGPTVAVRADIDALPIQEENQFSFCSTRSGLMHACGHDGHTAILLGLAQFLSQHRGFPGRVKLIFQAAEEKLPGGAIQLVEAGLMDDVDACIGLHLSSDFDLGTAGIAVGPITANSDSFRATVQGRGGHGSQPELTVDAVMVACHAVVNLQTVVSRKVSPMRPAVVSVGRIQAGGAANVIAERAEIAGTVRSQHSEIRQLLHDEIARTLESTCDMYGATLDLEYAYGYPALVNHPQVTPVLAEAGRAVLGERIIAMEPLMGGEDFAYYAATVPSAFMFLGARSEEAGSVWAHHHPRFTIDERSLPQGCEILGRAALALLKGRS